jgi:hypothetical protein
MEIKLQLNSCRYCIAKLYDFPGRDVYIPADKIRRQKNIKQNFPGAIFPAEFTFTQ